MLFTGPLLGVNFIILLGVGAFTRESLKFLRTTTGGLYKDETLSCETPVFPLVDDIFNEVFCKPLVEVPFEVFPLVVVPFEVFPMVEVSFEGIFSALLSSLVKSTAESLKVAFLTTLKTIFNFYIVINDFKKFR